MVSVRDATGVAVGADVGGISTTGVGVSASSLPSGNWQADRIKSNRIEANRLRFREWLIIGHPFRAGFVFFSKYAIKTGFRPS
jgi:hypothetical protein